MQVSSSSGDARRSLQLASCALDIARQGLPPSADPAMPLVKMEHVTRASHALMATPCEFFLSSMPTFSKFLLAVVLKTHWLTQGQCSIQEVMRKLRDLAPTHTPFDVG